jgi:sulfonate transport system substrate-binding protein
MSTGAVDTWCSWGVYVAQARLVDQARVVVDGSNGLLTGLSYLVAADAAIATRRPALLDFARRLAVARRWAKAHPDAYARVLAAEIGISEPVARLIYDTECPVPVAIDPQVIASEQKTADLYFNAKLIHTHLDATALFDASFNESLSG